MSNRMKAMYDIKLPKTNDSQSKIAVMAEDVNQTHLNDNFRTLVNEIVKLWDSGEHSLNLASSRMSATETGLAALNTIVDGIQVDTVENTSAIVQLPDSIMSSVSQTLTGYAPVVYVDEKTGELSYALESAVRNTTSRITQLPDSIMSSVSEKLEGYAVIGNMTGADANITSLAGTLAAARTTTTSEVRQSANELNVTIAQNTERSTDNATVINEVKSWVRIVGADPQNQTAAGVIIGSTASTTSLKAEADAIYFYKGTDAQAKPANQLAGFDANGNFVANAVHTNSMLIEDKFDIDLVTAGGVDFLHITGRT